MTRVEKDSQLKTKVENLTTQVKTVEKQEAKEQRISKFKLACGGLVLVVFLGLFFGISWIMAASGLVNVPIISPIAYKIPVPMQPVVPGVLIDAYVSEYFNSLITERLQAGSGELKERAVTVTLSEASLTASLRELLATENLSFFKTEPAQVAIKKDQGLEVFLPLANSSNNNALRLLLKIVVVNGKISVTYVRMTIGNLVLPDGFSKIVLKPFLDQGLQQANYKLGAYSTIDEILFEDNTLVVNGQLTVQVQEIK
ncbi:MAG: hypothetical protein V1664_01295 [Candidatus Uhrbacteria bacterium]